MSRVAGGWLVVLLMAAGVSAQEGTLQTQLLVGVPYPAPFAGRGLTLVASNNPAGAGSNHACRFGGSLEAATIEDVWMNQGQTPMDVVGIHLWMGADGGNLYDLGTLIRRGSDQSVLLFNNWDRYQEPTSTHDREYRFEPGVRLQPGDTLIVWSWCVAYGRPGAAASILTTLRMVWR